MEKEYRVIPGYESYRVSSDGDIKPIDGNVSLYIYLANGYYIVSVYRGALTKTLSIHRAVALAWVNNPNPSEYNIINHIDGDKLNNKACNLEWCNYSLNNYHAINNKLRLDNIPCKIFDIKDRVIIIFNSIAQAAAHMGLSKDSSFYTLRPKKFGKLLLGRYEFRFFDDPTPWFYEKRSEAITPARYKVIASHKDGSVEEIFGTKNLLKRFQLYESEKRSIPDLVEYAKILYPDIKFSFVDSYVEARYRLNKIVQAVIKQPVIAIKDDNKKLFDSITACAKYFNVDRSCIINRLGTNKELKGWILIDSPT